MKNRHYGWATALITNAVLIVLFIFGFKADWGFYGLACLIIADVVLISAWFSKLVDRKTGEKLIVTNNGGEYDHTVAGVDETGFYNDLGNINYDPRYPTSYYILLTHHNGKLMFGPPGYDKDLPADPDREFIDPRSWFEREFGKHFIGFFSKTYLQLQHTHVIKRRNVASKTEIEHAKFADSVYVAIEECNERVLYTPLFDEDSFIVSGRTGADGVSADGAFINEYFDANAPITVQVYVSNPLTYMTVTTDVRDALLSRIDAKIRDMFARHSFKTLQHDKYADYQGEFLDAMLSMNGKWTKDTDGKFVLTPGLDQGFGIRVTAQCTFNELSPGSEAAEKMLASSRNIIIAANSIQEKTNVGKATAAEAIETAKGTAESIKIVSTEQAAADQRIRKAAIEGGVNPEVDAKWKGVGKLSTYVEAGAEAHPVLSIATKKKKKGGDDED